jgi:integrase
VVSPCDMVDPSDRPKKKRSKRFEGRVYSDEEITRLCAFAGSWLQEIIVIGRYSGMRLGEILALDHESLDFEKREIHVIGTVRLDRSIGTTKSGEARIVPMHSEVEKVLRGKRGISGPVFRTQCGQRRSVNKTSRAFREVTGKAEIDGRFHDLRHTFASKLANSPEIPIAVTSRILGHADLSTTMKYVHPVEDGTLLARLEAAT